ncbi:MAG TPA: LPS export ABC transporter periplasmic protein LptC, partial [Acidobacteriota bacterium]|nr:LPS export ABC transporter periplasmic protein LptC [Acidobacteriota bacterium]
MQPPIVKTIRRVLLVIILLVILAVIFNYLHALYRQNDASRTMPEMLGSEYMRSVESIEYFEHRNGVLRFRIKAHKLLETRDSRNLLDGIEAWDFNDEGVMRNSIRSDKAEYDRERKVVDFIGDVRLFIGNDVELQTPALRYDLNDNVATTSDSMRFLSGAMSGTARGINYDQDREMLKLESDVSFVFSPVRDDTDGRNETGRIHVTSRQGTAALLRNELIFEGGAMITAENQGTIHGERIEITLSPDHRRIDSLRAGGQAAYRFDDGTATRILSGDRMVFAIGDSGNLEKIAVSERAGLAAKSPAQEERLSADAIDVIFDAVTGSVAEVHGRTGVTLHMKRGNEETAASGEYLKADFIPGAGRL